MKIKPLRQISHNWARGMVETPSIQCPSCGDKTRMDRLGFWQCRRCKYPGHKMQVRRAQS